MLVKVCGINNPNNLEAMDNLAVDFIGINFYNPSPRHWPEDAAYNFSQIKTPLAGVFVNASIDQIKSTTRDFNLEYVQCHGNESIAFCQEVKTFTKCIKVFSVSSESDIQQTKDFDFCDYFLFDTKTKQHGGSGQKFDWRILNSYQGKTPFLLAGGIGPNDSDEIQSINHPEFRGVDINSKFEIKPGLKDLKLVQEFINQIKERK